MRQGHHLLRIVLGHYPKLLVVVQEKNCPQKEPDHGHHLDGAHTFHVEGTPSPDHSIFVDKARQGPLVIGPVFRLGGGDIDVGHEAQGWLTAS